MKRYILSLDQLSTMVEEFLQQFPSGVVILRGDLAAGKTTLVKEFVKFLKKDADVTSPTFSLQQVYGDNVFHYDIYNKGLEHFISLGLLEELEKEGLHFVEWGDEKLQQLLKNAGFDVATIDIEKISPEKREYKVCIN